jgi:formylglycine-generating enzyme required for sulfatase activity
MRDATDHPLARATTVRSNWRERTLALVAWTLVMGFWILLIRAAGPDRAARSNPGAALHHTVTLDPAVAGARLWVGPRVALPVPDDGVLKVLDLPPGEHELTVRAPGYLPYTTRLQITAPGATTVRLVAQRGTLHVRARPGSTVVAINAAGRESALGQVPAPGLLVSEGLLPIGTYALRVTHPDCAPLLIEEITLGANRPAQVNPVQSPLPAELRVVSVPSGATVRLDGRPRGATPLTLHPPAETEVTLTVELPGYVRAETTLQLRPREVRTIELGPLVPESGALALHHAPADLPRGELRLWVDDRAVPLDDDGTVQHLALGQRRVRVEHPDYEPWQGGLLIEKDRTTPLTVTLRPKPGRVRLVGAPPDLQLALNGRAVTPHDGIVDLPPGQAVTLIAGAPRHHAQTLTLTLAPNQTHTWQVQLERQRLPRPGHDHENSLGMVFTPVPGTGVLFSIWETREQDFAAYVAAREREWDHPARGPTHPAAYVSWDDAQDFCAWLTEHERRQGWLREDQRYRLPTDVEWSVAVGLPAEAGDSPAESDRQRIEDHYPWGDYWPPPYGAGNYGEELNVDPYEGSAPVGSFKANAFDLYDMGGNVWEWVEDAWHARSRNRVLRGASFAMAYPDDLLLSAYRLYFAPSTRFDYIGFRVVLEP